jgi:hypothetical protein
VPRLSKHLLRVPQPSEHLPHKPEHHDSISASDGCTPNGTGGELQYGDEKGSNRDIRVWHGATEKGP